MKIKNLELENIRNFKALKISFSETLTVIYGSNAVGKTNLLEAIYFLTLTKFPRKIKEKDIIKKEEKQGRIKGDFKINNTEELEIEFFLGPQKIGKINKNKTKIREILGKASSILFSAEDLYIIDSPEKRRRFLNILLSLLDKKYFLNLLDYQKALKRRNKVLLLLKMGKGEKQEIKFWDKKLASLGSYIIKEREKIIKEINSLFKNFPLFFKKGPLVLEYKPQATSELKILEELKTRFERDKALGQTSLGPHRDFIKFKTGEMDLEIFGSRGEKRAAIVELKKAEIEILKKAKKIKPILLLDDVFSELDKENKKNVLKLISGQQTIITTTDLGHLKEETVSAKIYKLENGEIKNGAYKKSA